MAKQPSAKKPKSELESIREELIRTTWWWRHRDELGVKLAEMAQMLATEARRVFEAEFEPSAWNYEAYRRFHDKTLPSYPELTHEQRQKLAETWPNIWRESVEYTYPTEVLKCDTPRDENGTPKKGWTKYVTVSFNLSLRNNELTDEIEKHIEQERLRLGIPNPKQSPGRPRTFDQLWRGLEYTDLFERVDGYTDIDPNAPKERSEAKRKAKDLVLPGI